MTSNRNLRPEELAGIYRTMFRIRRFEERTAELFAEGLVKGTAHSYVGEEAIAAGVCAALQPGDAVGSYHRGHGHCIAKGADLARMMAELMGRATGYCGGLGGSMHIADLELGILGANGIVGAAMPLCVGAALAVRLRRGEQVVVAFFGDGAANQGVFHESMNLAAVWKLPLLFVCENNHYALTTPIGDTTAGPSIAGRAAAYGVPGVRIDGNDPEEVYFAVAEARDRARAGEGPSLIEAMTYRWGQHSMRANLRDPRPPEEYRSWIARDPIPATARALTERGALDEAGIAAIGASVEAELAEAIDVAKRGAQPEAQDALDAVYAPFAADVAEPPEGGRELAFSEALNEALHQEMERDGRVFVMGEDVGATGGIFRITRGLWERFGAERVRDTPISEATFVGAGVGAAIAGLRPVVELQFFDFVTQAMDMVVNQAAKFRFMLGGKPTVPMVLRGPHGGGIRVAAQHSQSLEVWFAATPGLVVIGPSTPYDAKGLLAAAIRNDNPVIFLESKLLYLSGKGMVPEQPYALPIGKGRRLREGRDVTLVATMAMVPRALAAAAQLEREGVSVEVIDPRTLKPLDEDLILSSVRKTNRLVVAHEAGTQFGFGAEIAAIAVEKAFDWLDAPVVRVGSPDVPMPYNDELERWAIPSQARILEGVRRVFEI